MRIYISFILGVVSLLSTGCQVNAADAGAPVESTTSPMVEPVFPTEGVIAMTPSPPADPELPILPMPTETDSNVTDGVPVGLLSKIIADLADRTGAAADRITVLQGQATVWNDGSLGCPQPGIFYTQALVNGFWVILEAEGQTYDYRVSESGYFFICQDGILPLAPSGTPGS